MDDLTFETALSQLEETVSLLEAGDLTLEQSLALYERGQKLSAWCTGQLEQARLRVEMLSADGELISLAPPASDD